MIKKVLLVLDASNIRGMLTTSCAGGVYILLALQTDGQSLFRNLLVILIPMIYNTLRLLE